MKACAAAAGDELLVRFGSCGIWAAGGCARVTRVFGPTVADGGEAAAKLLAFANGSGFAFTSCIGGSEAFREVYQPAAQPPAVAEGPQQQRPDTAERDEAAYDRLPLPN